MPKQNKQNTKAQGKLFRGLFGISFRKKDKPEGGGLLAEQANRGPNLFSDNLVNAYCGLVGGSFPDHDQALKRVEKLVKDIATIDHKIAQIKQLEEVTQPSEEGLDETYKKLEGLVDDKSVCVAELSKIRKDLEDARSDIELNLSLREKGTPEYENLIVKHHENNYAIYVCKKGIRQLEKTGSTLQRDLGTSLEPEAGSSKTEVQDQAPPVPPHAQTITNSNQIRQDQEVAQDDKKQKDLLDQIAPSEKEAYDVLVGGNPTTSGIDQVKEQAELNLQYEIKKNLENTKDITKKNIRLYEKGTFEHDKYTCQYREIMEELDACKERISYLKNELESNNQAPPVSQELTLIDKLKALTQSTAEDFSGIQHASADSPSKAEVPQNCPQHGEEVQAQKEEVEEVRRLEEALQSADRNLLGIREEKVQAPKDTQEQAAQAAAMCTR